jgi:MoaA/NifB/PqqE/SkfB family radical SAM enzyme
MVHPLHWTVDEPTRSHDQQTQPGTEETMLRTSSYTIFVKLPDNNEEGPAGIARLQITLDGPPREHDKRRVYADGAGSYERIAANIAMALELGVAVSVRLNVDRNNMGDPPAVADEIVACGWDRCPGFGDKSRAGMRHFQVRGEEQ